MKALITLILFGFSIQMIGQESEEKEIVRGLFEKVWNQQDFSFFKDLKDDTITFHLNTQTFQTNTSELKNLITYWHSSFDDFKFEILSLIQEGNMISTNLIYTGTQKKTFMGVPSQGNKIQVAEMMFFRFNEGKLEEAWEIYDEKGMIAQMEKEK